jgi:hypothetical protein
VLLLFKWVFVLFSNRKSSGARIASIGKAVVIKKAMYGLGNGRVLIGTVLMANGRTVTGNEDQLHKETEGYAHFCDGEVK